MTALSAGHIAAIAVACSALSAILAGAITHWLDSRRNRKKPWATDTPWRDVFRECTQLLTARWLFPRSRELVPDIVHHIEILTTCLSLNREDLPAFIQTFKAAVPCDGVVNADWPLWERLLLDFEDKNRAGNRSAVLSIIIAHWLVAKMQPDGDETMTFLPPDFVSLRKRIMAEPQYDRRKRAIQQMWSFMTMALQTNKEVTRADAWALPPPSDCRTPGVMRIREELLRLLDPWIDPDPQERNCFFHTLDTMLGLATVIASYVLCYHKGESVLFWKDPKTQAWPHAEERLEDDDYFLLRFPAILKPKGCLGDELDGPDPEPRRQGLLPPPVRDWLHVPMEQDIFGIPAESSLKGRYLKDRNLV